MQTRHWTCYLPGCWLADLVTKDQLPQLALPYLQRLLARAQRLPDQVVEEGISKLFTLFAYSPHASWSAAAVTGLAHGLATSQGYWLRADPICVQADLNTAYAFPCTELSLSQAQQLASQLTELLASYAIRCHVVTADTWYLQAPQLPALYTQPTTKVWGRPLTSYLPNDKFWQQLLTEIQMVLHTSEVNRQRSLQGLLPVNSVWLWGAGALPHSVASPWQYLLSDDLTAQGLATLASVAYSQVSEQALQQALAHAAVLFVQAVKNFVPGQDRAAHLASLAELDALLWQFLYKSLCAKQLDSVTLLLPEGMSYHITAAAVRRWWQPKRAWRKELT